MNTEIKGHGFFGDAIKDFDIPLIAECVFARYCEPVEPEICYKCKSNITEHKYTFYAGKDQPILCHTCKNMLEGDIEKSIRDFFISKKSKPTPGIIASDEAATALLRMKHD